MEDKADKVNDVFSSVSSKYDLMNDIMSFGLHRLWKKQFLRLCNLDNKNKILDIACGTGDISLGIMKHNSNIKLTCLDPNNEMIVEADFCPKRFVITICSRSDSLKKLFSALAVSTSPLILIFDENKSLPLLDA